MGSSIRKLVVRYYAPERRAWLLAGAVLLALGLLFASFEMGRYDAGFRVVESVRGSLATRARIAALEADNARQREELEAADVSRRVDREGYKEVEQSLGDMQNQIARLNQDLSFYRGLVQPDSVVHVKVQQMQIVAEKPPSVYRLKFVLMQTGKPEKSVTGNVAITVDGLLRGKPASLSFTQISPNRRGGLAYSFRYFQDYDEPVELPLGFEPTRIGVEIYAGRDVGHGFQQAFVWKAQGMTLETEAPAADIGVQGGKPRL